MGFHWSSVYGLSMRCCCTPAIVDALVASAGETLITSICQVGNGNLLKGASQASQDLRDFGGWLDSLMWKWDEQAITGKKKKKLYDWGEEMKTDRISGQKISLIGKQANSVTLIRRSVLRWLLKLAFCHQTSVLDRQVVFVDLRPKNFQDLFIECWIVSSKCLSLQKASSSNMCRPLCLDKWSGEKIDVLDVWFAKKNADQGSGRDRLSFSFGLIP